MNPSVFEHHGHSVHERLVEQNRVPSEQRRGAEGRDPKARVRSRVEVFAARLFGEVGLRLVGFEKARGLVFNELREVRDAFATGDEFE